MQQIVAAFVRWYDQLFAEPGNVKDDASWLSSRMEYAFAVGAPTPGPSFTTAGGAGTETVLVSREYSSGHLARWFNGALLLWLGRRKLAGRGEGSSGLKFDRARKSDATNS